jgi:hypothetical protein
MKTGIFIWSPAFTGALLLLVSQIDLILFKAEILGVRTMLTWELVLVLVGLIGGVIVLIYGVACLFRKKWSLAMQALLSPLVFLILFGLGGSLGGAYLNAT